MVDYGIVVLGVLARRQGEILATSQLAELSGLNQPTVSKVAKTLAVADLLETQSGVYRGYRLVRQAATTLQVKIVEAIEGPIAVNDYVVGAHDPCMVSSCCFMSRNWKRVNSAMRYAFNDVSLGDLMNPAQLLGPADQEKVTDRKVPSAKQSEMLS